MTEDLKQIAIALKRLEQAKLIKAFDADNPKSRPTKSQQEILDDIDTVKYRYVVAGNRCLEEGTLVATPEGPIAIEKIKTGDTVFDEYGNPIKVIKSFSNGQKAVHDLTHRGRVVASCTDNHVWLTRNSSSRKPRQEELSVKDFKRDTQIKRVEIDCPLGEVHNKSAYALGALLGDGCSSQDSVVPTKVFEIPHYKEWCHNKYAHEKLADLDIIRTWDRVTLLNYVAGLIDTDGSVYINEYDNLCISIEMQAKSVIESIQYAILALWQISVTIYTYDREKYKNGPTYAIRVANNAVSKRMLKELDTYLVTPSKKYKTNYDSFTSERTNPYWTGVKVSKETRLVNTYDIHVDSDTNLYCLANGLVTHNSGKSQLAARELAWILTETHPTFVRPEEWGSSGITAIIAGQDLTVTETELWKKLKTFLVPSEWRHVKQGNTLKRLEHKKTGNQIVFLSHSDGSETNRRHMQGYTAHYVWLDEMPASAAILEELQGRIATTNGRFIATFTPKFRNDSIRKVVDAAVAPYAKKYTISMLDNPRVNKEEQLARLAGKSKAEINTVLYGAWSTGENAVYHFDYEQMTVEQLPEYYHKGWRHVESVDPASKSKFGYTLWAEDPSTGIWYLINDEYLEGEEILDPNNAFRLVQQRSAGYNIIRRISDTMAWYVGIASSNGVSYLTPYDKNSRKDELIKNLQSKLSTGKIKIGRWCSNFIDEIQGCQWSETSDRIINSSSYHELDCAQYFCDNIPKTEVINIIKPQHVEIREANQARKQAEYQRIKIASVNKTSAGRIRPIVGWGRQPFRRAR